MERDGDEEPVLAFAQPGILQERQHPGAEEAAEVHLAAVFEGVQQGAGSALAAEAGLGPVECEAPSLAGGAGLAQAAVGGHADRQRRWIPAHRPLAGQAGRTLAGAGTGAANST